MDIFIKNGVIKKQDEVEQTIYKKHFDIDYKSTQPGPYYDPFNNHCHVWKPVSLIQNFKGEQNQTSSKYIKHDKIPTKGLYCSICHLRLMSKGYNLQKTPDLSHYFYFKKRKTRDEDELTKSLKSVKITSKNSLVLWDRFYILLARDHVAKYKRVYDSVVKIKTKEKEVINRWSSLVKKLIEPVVYYQISGFKSIPIKISQMTPFQKFKYCNPDYRTKSNFIIYNNRFNTNYVTIA